MGQKGKRTKVLPNKRRKTVVKRELDKTGQLFDSESFKKETSQQITVPKPVVTQHMPLLSQEQEDVSSDDIPQSTSAVQPSGITARKAKKNSFDIRLYHKAGPAKIAEKLAEIGCRVIQQDDELYQIYPTAEIQLCHATNTPLTIRRPWQTKPLKEPEVNVHCTTCLYPQQSWEAIHELIHYGRVI